MNEYIVSLDFVTSDSVTATQLSELIGVEAAELDSRPSRKVDNEIYWRFEPDNYDNANLAAGIESLSLSIHPRHTINVDKDIKGIYLSIGVLFDYQVFGSAIFSLSSIASLTSNFPDLVIDISTYPCKLEDDEEEET